MFDTQRSLIVVYKNEMILNQLKKLVESNDDTEQEIVGTKDKSINIIAWTEEVWLDNKRPGNIQEKVLFIDDIKDTDKLIPVLDIKFDKYGVTYGWAGNQAVLFVDSKKLTNRSTYLNFVHDLSSLPMPEAYKHAKNASISYGHNGSQYRYSKTKNNHSSKNFVINAGKQLAKGVQFLEKTGVQIAMNAEDHLRDKQYVTTQMLFYGVIQFYNNSLEEFMNS